jgi:hypothetical protein
VAQLHGHDGLVRQEGVGRLWKKHVFFCWTETVIFLNRPLAVMLLISNQIFPWKCEFESCPNIAYVD